MSKKMRIIPPLLLGLVLLLSGCGKEASSLEESQIANQEAKLDTSDTSNQANSEAAINISDQQEDTAPNDFIEITEKMYVTYINDIYTNIEAYKGKTIKLEGMFTSAYDESTKQSYYFVYRTGPGCCGNDGSMCGFEFTTTDPLPKENDWIEVVGTLDSYEENGYTYLTLREAEVTIKAERGLEVVNQ